MFMRNICRVWAGIVLVLLLPGVLQAHQEQWKMVHGDIVQVLTEEHKLLLASNGQEVYLVLEEDCRIFRQGAPATLASLRPVGPGAYQDALCWINPQGRVGLLLVNYHVEEENGMLVAYDIFGNRK